MAVEAVRFGFMSDEEVRKHSVVGITNLKLVDDDTDKPFPGGLYDPALGPLGDSSKCLSCGQRSYHCPGHFGHIDLVFPVYNPLSFKFLRNILNTACFSCRHFKVGRLEVETCVSQLHLIRKGDIAGARRLRSLGGLSDKLKKNWGVSYGELQPEDSQGSHSTGSVVLSESESGQDLNWCRSWDSIQLTEAMGVLNEFFRKKEKKCKNCESRSPKITNPIFGWFYAKGLPASHARADAIHRSSSKGTHIREGKDKPSPENSEASSSIISADSPGNSGKKGSSSNKLNLGLVGQRHLLPSEVREMVMQLWENEESLCSFICDIQQQQGKLSGNRMDYSIFFFETILVNPIKFRAPTRGGNSVMEHPHTVLLGKVLESNIALRNAQPSKFISHWMELQQSINVLFDGKSSTSKKAGVSGICQLLEKKEGVFRQKMMGKRVNFACRSVISPDPYLAVNEIGIPPYFALRLTYPERVTPWNATKLRNAVVNGPDIHPGATTYIDSVATMKLPLNKKARVALSRKLPSSRGATAEVGESQLDFEGKVVYRHLQDGDIVLVNRQPTLHKPSIMAHVVRVLKGERTLRMHYANCSSYNADFDGDEINVHFPQDEISRAEAYNIVNANEQYIVPTRGDTVRGLIQDHIVAAVLLTLKRTFLTCSEFNQLLYGSGVFALGRHSYVSNSSQKVSGHAPDGLINPILPAIWKPEPLWTGKQVISALLNHITRGFAPCIVKNQTKLPSTYFTDNPAMEDEDEDQNAENNFLVWKNELVRGVIDKAQFGKFGLVHTVQELYGSESAGNLLTAFSRLFTMFLQIHGFTCGVDDLMILPDYDVKRKEKLEQEDVGEEVHCDFINFKPGQIGREELQLEIEKAICRDRESATALLDMKMKNKLTMKLTTEGSQVLKHLLTDGLLKPFPQNCISVMTTTGAKGSTVNFQQISAYLGQQELEGKRVPRMVSGKTLPSFPPWDFASRAGGFITDRFLSGLRPQEYYFHCMAGREGLVDTAVKTSRSGYLQRCLVKNLESLKVGYDYTVRDADGSIIQFCYGEDGVDAHKTSFLKNFKALSNNQETIQQKFQNKHQFNFYIKKLPEGLEEEAMHFIQKAQTLSSVKQVVGVPDKRHKSRKKSKKLQLDSTEVTVKDHHEFMRVVEQKFLSSLVPAGEPVGVIAAQSIGEPSTQMTLNTFHLAGRGEMNVTLGIPRLQEILMTASEVIRTPMLTCPFLQRQSKPNALSVISNLKKITIADLIESMDVSISFHPKVGRIYKLRMRLKDTEFVSLEDTYKTLKTSFLKELEDALENHVVFLKKVAVINDFASHSRFEALSEGEEDKASDGAQEAEEEDDDDGGDSDAGEDLDSDVQKRRQQARDDMDYEDASDSEQREEEEDLDKANAEEDDDDDENEWNEKCDDDHDDYDQRSSEKNMVEKPILKGRKKSVAAITSEKIDLSTMPSTGKRENRAIYMEIEGLSLEVHFKFTSEPHVLLAQVVQKTAKKVYVKKTGGKLNQCKLVQYDPDEKTVIWDDDKKKEKATKNGRKADDDAAYWAVKASGSDVESFWEMSDYLDLNRLYCNNIHSMLKTYGVEAASATIIREMKNVFDIYGVKIDYRHLSLIGDHMAHAGGYRPMSRHGSIPDSVSPFLKMSFETASKFIVEAAIYGLRDDLESPSSRICLGLPVRVGTGGSFDLMLHNTLHTR